MTERRGMHGSGLGVENAEGVEPAPDALYEVQGCCSENSIGYLMRRIVLSMVTDIDRRVRSTDGKGGAVVIRVPGVIAEVLNGYLTGFIHDEWQTLLGMLRRVAVNAEAFRDVAQASRSP